MLKTNYSHKKRVGPNICQSPYLSILGHDPQISAPGTFTPFTWEVRAALLNMNRQIGDPLQTDANVLCFFVGFGGKKCGTKWHKTITNRWLQFGEGIPNFRARV